MDELQKMSVAMTKEGLAWVRNEMLGSLTVGGGGMHNPYWQCSQVKVFLFSNVAFAFVFRLLFFWFFFLLQFSSCEVTTLLEGVDFNITTITW